jgi:hypothetical protein
MLVLHNFEVSPDAENWNFEACTLVLLEEMLRHRANFTYCDRKLCLSPDTRRWTRRDSECAHEVDVQALRVFVSHVFVSVIELFLEAQRDPLTGFVGDAFRDREREARIQGLS